MSTQLDFCLLGPLVVRQNGLATAVLPAKQRVLLATLLLSANQVVSLDELAEAMWGSSPPKSARSTLRNYVKCLRKALPEGPRSRISTEPGGYLCRVHPGELDIDIFEELVSSARAVAITGSWEQTVYELRRALSLWRGEALADVASEVLALRELPRLTEMRLQAMEARIEAELQLGRHGDVIAELRKLTVVHPLRERLYALLMLALYRDGQQGAAMAAYHRARRVLVEELATEPGPELRQLEQQILAADPTLVGPAPSKDRDVADRRPARPVQHTGPAVPRQLPTTVRNFTGRVGELMALIRMSSATAPGLGGAVMISVISGTAGVGKTALAVHWSHMVTDRFPDGQLFVNLRGYDPAGPANAADTLTGFLRALGVPAQNIPSEIDECAAQFRSILADRRVLVVPRAPRALRRVVASRHPAAPGPVCGRCAAPSVVALTAKAFKTAAPGPAYWGPGSSTWRASEPPRLVVVRSDGPDMGYPVPPDQGRRQRGRAASARAGTGHHRRGDSAPAGSSPPRARDPEAALALACGIRPGRDRQAVAAA